MQDDYYGLRARPFQPAPDPRFWFETAAHGMAMTCLRHALGRGQGDVVVTGAAGVGKTILLRRLAGDIDGQDHRLLQIASEDLRAEDLIRLVGQALGVDLQGISQAAALFAIDHHARAAMAGGGRILLLVDDAQLLSEDCWHVLRQLSTLEAGALFRLFLFGEPHLLRLVEDAESAQRRDGVIATAHLGAIEIEEVAPYLRHRLHCAGGHGRPRFTSEACAALHRWSGGVARRLNLVADRLLLHGASVRIDTFGAPDVAAAIEDIEVDGAGEALDFVPEALPPADTSPTGGGMDMALLAERVAELEARLRGQQDALRQVLAVLVEWVEQDEERRSISLQALRDALR